MKARVRVFGSAFAALVVLCFLAWPPLTAAAAAATSGEEDDQPRLEFRFDNDDYAVTSGQIDAAEPQKFSRLAVRLYGGLSRVAAGDVNEGVDGYFELLEIYESEGLGSLTGGYSPVHMGANFGADFIYQISPMIGIGFGIGYLRSSSDSELTLAYEGGTFSVEAKPTLSAVPIHLGVFLTFPAAGRISLTASAGAAYYAGLKLEGTELTTSSSGYWDERTLSATRSSLANLGFQGSLGFEYEFSSKIGFFVEALGRYAKFKNFETVTGTHESSGGSLETTEGKLYIQTETDPEWSFSIFTVESTPPVDDVDTTYREPKIDLSGFSLQAGIRIRF